MCWNSDRTLRDVVPPPVDDQDSDEDEDYAEDDEEGEDIEQAEDFFGGGAADEHGAAGKARSPKADTAASRGAASANQSKSRLVLCIHSIASMYPHRELTSIEVANFERIVGDMVLTGFSENHAIDNVLMEIKGLKFAENRDFADCIHGALPVLLDLALKKASGPGAAAPSVPALVAAIKDFLDKSTSKWGYQLLRALIQGETDE
jgi:hypothetical protein